MKSGTTTSFQSKVVRKHLEESDQLEEALKYRVENPHFRNLRRFSVYSGYNDVDALVDAGLLTTKTPGSYLLIRRTGDQILDTSRNALHFPSQQEAIHKVLKRWAEEVEACGWSLPFTLDQKPLFWSFLSERQEVERICKQIRFGETERSESFNTEKYGFPYVTPISRWVLLTDEGKAFLEEYDFGEVDTSFIEMMEKIQFDAGVFTTITQDTEGQYRLLYPQLKDSNLTENQLVEVIQRYEREMAYGVPILKDDLQQTIAQIKRDDEGAAGVAEVGA